MDVERGRRIAARLDRLGLASIEVAATLGIDPQTVRRVRDGQARPATMGVIERYLDDLDDDPDGVPAAGIVETLLELPTGRVRVTGAPSDVAALVRDLLSGRAPGPPPDDILLGDPPTDTSGSGAQSA